MVDSKDIQRDIQTTETLFMIANGHEPSSRDITRRGRNSLEGDRAYDATKNIR